MSTRWKRAQQGLWTVALILALGVWLRMPVDYQQLVDDINAALQGIAQEAFAFSVGEELPLLAPASRVTFTRRGVQPPSSAYLRRDDGIQLNVWNAVTGASVLLSGRFLKENGDLLYISELLTPTTDRAQSQVNRQLGEGFLLNASLQVQGATPQRGETFAVLTLTQGQGVSLAATSVLISDYLSAASPSGWPDSTVIPSSAGQGAFKAYTMTLSGGNTISSITVPANTRWKILNISGSVSLSVVAGNRNMFISVTGAGGNFAAWCPDAMPALTLAAYYASRYGGAIAPIVASQYALVLPGDAIADTGMLIRVQMLNVQAGDTQNPAVISVEEWVST